MSTADIILDANAVLRYLLNDISDQHDKVEKTIRSSSCHVTLEVLTEATYVLEGVYAAPRSEICESFRKLCREISVQNVDVLLRALEIFDKPPKLDIVDCLMYGYKKCRGMEVLTFDQKLQKKLNSI